MNLSKIRSMTDLINFYGERDKDGDGKLKIGDAGEISKTECGEGCDNDGDGALSPWESMEAVNRYSCPIPALSNRCLIFRPEDITEMKIVGMFPYVRNHTAKQEDRPFSLKLLLAKYYPSEKGQGVDFDADGELELEEKVGDRDNEFPDGSGLDYFLFFVEYRRKFSEPLLKELEGKLGETLQDLGSVVNPERWHDNLLLLGVIGNSQAYEHILPFLNSPFAPVQVAAVFALGALKDSRATNLLLEKLDKPDYGAPKEAGLYDNHKIAEAIAWALSEINTPRASQPLLKLLSTMNSKLVREALVKINDPTLVDTLIPLLEGDRYTTDTSNIAEILGRRKEAKAVPALRQAMRYQMASFQPTQIPEPGLLSPFGKLQRDVAVKMKTLDPYFNGLTEAKRKEEEPRIAAAALALGRIGDQESVPALLVLLDHDNRDIRCSAIQSLGLLGSQDAVEKLRELMIKDSDSYVRTLAEKALVPLIGKEQVRQLQEEAKIDSAITALTNGVVRSWELSKLGDTVVPKLVRAGYIDTEGVIQSEFLNVHDVTGLRVDLSDSEKRKAFSILSEAHGFADFEPRVRAIDTLKKMVNPNNAERIAEAFIKVFNVLNWYGIIRALEVFAKPDTPPKVQERIVDLLLRELSQTFNSDAVELICSTLRPFVTEKTPLEMKIKIVDGYLRLLKREPKDFQKSKAACVLRDLVALAGYSELQLDGKAMDIPEQVVVKILSSDDFLSYEGSEHLYLEVLQSYRQGAAAKEIAEKMLIRLGAKAAMSLVYKLEDPKCIEHARIARVLGEIGDERALEILKKLRGDGLFNRSFPNPKVVKAADEAIKKIEAKR